eukprot:GHVU01147705.1.p2 GENE.GHVU01147705.1~~GHVU01147705.1.p2  ORF type:complete len:151 (-),score=25.44 GHVU01147705.1:136-588(-)
MLWRVLALSCIVKRFQPSLFTLRKSLILKINLEENWNWFLFLSATSSWRRPVQLERISFPFGIVPRWAPASSPRASRVEFVELGAREREAGDTRKKGRKGRNGRNGRKEGGGNEEKEQEKSIKTETVVGAKIKEYKRWMIREKKGTDEDM